MNIKILHIYHDLLNLYGERGNVEVIKRHLELHGHDVTADRKSIGDNIDFSAYDFIYAGSGTEKNQKTALAHLIKIKDSFAAAAASGTVILMTGNAFEMVGKSIETADGKKYECLNIGNFAVRENSAERKTGDIILNYEETGEQIAGFINRSSYAYDVHHPLFDIAHASCDMGGMKQEGVRINNLFGTYVIGPILFRNTHFAEYLISLILHNKGCNEFEPIIADSEKRAYDVTLNELNKVFNAKGI